MYKSDLKLPYLKYKDPQLLWLDQIKMLLLQLKDNLVHQPFGKSQSKQMQDAPVLYERMESQDRSNEFALILK